MSKLPGPGFASKLRQPSSTNQGTNGAVARRPSALAYNHRDDQSSISANSVKQVHPEADCGTEYDGNSAEATSKNLSRIADSLNYAATTQTNTAPTKGSMLVRPAKKPGVPGGSLSHSNVPYSRQGNDPGSAAPIHSVGKKRGTGNLHVSSARTGLPLPRGRVNPSRVGAANPLASAINSKTVAAGRQGNARGVAMAGVAPRGMGTSSYRTVSRGKPMTRSGSDEVGPPRLAWQEDRLELPETDIQPLTKRPNSAMLPPSKVPSRPTKLNRYTSQSLQSLSSSKTQSTTRKKHGSLAGSRESVVSESSDTDSRSKDNTSSTKTESRLAKPLQFRSGLTKLVRRTDITRAESTPNRNSPDGSVGDQLADCEAAISPIGNGIVKKRTASDGAMNKTATISPDTKLHSTFVHIDDCEAIQSTGSEMTDANTSTDVALNETNVISPDTNLHTTYVHSEDCEVTQSIGSDITKARTSSTDAVLNKTTVISPDTKLHATFTSSTKKDESTYEHEMSHVEATPLNTTKFLDGTYTHGADSSSDNNNCRSRPVNTTQTFASSFDVVNDPCIGCESSLEHIANETFPVCDLDCDEAFFGVESSTDSIDETEMKLSSSYEIISHDHTVATPIVTSEASSTSHCEIKADAVTTSEESHRVNACSATRSEIPANKTEADVKDAGAVTKSKDITAAIVSRTDVSIDESKADLKDTTDAIVKSKKKVSRTDASIDKSEADLKDTTGAVVKLKENVSRTDASIDKFDADSKCVTPSRFGNEDRPLFRRNTCLGLAHREAARVALARTSTSFRPPRQMTLFESDVNGNVEIDSWTYHQFVNEMRSMKTSLLKLKRELQESEVMSPLATKFGLHSLKKLTLRDPHTSPPSSPSRPSPRPKTFSDIQSWIALARKDPDGSAVEEQPCDVSSLKRQQTPNHPEQINIEAASTDGVTNAIKDDAVKTQSDKEIIAELRKENLSLRFTNEELEHEMESRSYTIKLLQTQLEKADFCEELEILQEENILLREEAQELREELEEVCTKQAAASPGSTRKSVDQNGSRSVTMTKRRIGFINRMYSQSEDVNEEENAHPS